MKSVVTKEEWIGRLRKMGMDETTMHQWHQLFEKENPQGHQSFLEWLGLSAEEITSIRQG